MQRTTLIAVLVALIALAAAAVALRRADAPPATPPQPSSYAIALDMSATVKNLGSDDDAVAGEAVDTIVAQGAGALPLLAAVLEREEAPVREKALEALRQLKLPDSVPILTKALAKDEDVDVRYDSALLLGEIADPRGREAVEAALQDPTWDVRLGAARACATLCSSPAAIDRLAWMAIEDQPPQAGIWARSSLVKLMKAPPAGGGASADVAALARAAIEKRAKPAVAADGALEPRVRAALLLSDLGDLSGIAVLRTAVIEPLAPVLMPYPLYALGEFGDASAVPPLAQALANDRAEARVYAYDALRKLGERGVAGASEAAASFAGQKPNASLPSPLP